MSIGGKKWIRIRTTNKDQRFNILFVSFISGSMPNQGSDSKIWYPNSTTASSHSQSPKTFNFDSNPTSTADSGTVAETLRWVLTDFYSNWPRKRLLSPRNWRKCLSWSKLTKQLLVSFPFFSLLHKHSRILGFVHQSSITRSPIHDHILRSSCTRNSIRPVDTCDWNVAATSFPGCHRWSGSLCSRWTIGSGRHSCFRCCRTSRTTSARWTCSSWCARCWTRTSSRRWTGRETPSSSRISRWVGKVLNLSVDISVRLEEIA